MASIATVVMPENKTKMWLSNVYNMFIWAIQTYLTTPIPVHEQFYAVYVSNGQIKYSSIIRYMTANGQRYYYNLQYVFAKDGNPAFENVLIYDFSLSNNQDLYVSENIWDGSHINISPDFTHLLLNYHYTIYNPQSHIERPPPPLRVLNEQNYHPHHSHNLRNQINIEHEFCKLDIAEWYYSGNNPRCFNEGYSFNNIRGKHLRPRDGKNILNSALPGLIYQPNPHFQQAGVEKPPSKKQQPIASYFKITKIKTDTNTTFDKEMKMKKIANKKPDPIISKHSSAICKYIEKLAKDNNITLDHTSVLLFNPHKPKEPGLIILNCNIHLDPYTNPVKKTSKKTLKGYFKKEIITTDILD
jgi:hypothetical protein